MTRTKRKEPATKNRLKELATQMPDVNKFIDIIHQLEGHTSREAVIVGASLLEFGTKFCLAQWFTSRTGAELQPIFERTLQRQSARLDILYAIGAIDATVLGYFRAIARIRDSFTHGLLLTDLKSADVDALQTDRLAGDVRLRIESLENVARGHSSPLSRIDRFVLYMNNDHLAYGDVAGNCVGFNLSQMPDDPALATYLNAVKLLWYLLLALTLDRAYGPTAEDGTHS